SNTSLTQGTIGSLSVNTTYYGRVDSIISGSSSAWSAGLATATLANIPATAVSTWTVNITSITVAWTRNGNPSGITKYIVELSTENGFGAGITLTSTTYNLNGTFTNLIPDTTYYAQVK